MRALLLSDTHGHHWVLDVPQKGYTLAIHTGDFSNRGSEEEADDFLLWYADLPCKHKILVAGNHDWYAYKHSDRFKMKCALLGIAYLEDSSIEINGVKFYGTPWCTQFYDWAFMKSESELIKHWKAIPTDTDVLLTHTPPLGVLDRVFRGNVGSSTLAQYIASKLDLQLHVFGHIHECAGHEVTTTHRSINAACVNDFREEVKPRIINIKGK